MVSGTEICFSFPEGETWFTRVLFLKIFLCNFDIILETVSFMDPIIVEVIQCLANFFIVGFCDSVKNGMSTWAIKSEKNSCKDLGINKHNQSIKILQKSGIYLVISYNFWTLHKSLFMY